VRGDVKRVVDVLRVLVVDLGDEAHAFRKRDGVRERLRERGVAREFDDAQQLVLVGAEVGFEL
jgi:hypothetical protein